MIIPIKPISSNKNKKVYFPKEAEEAIVEYNSTSDPILKSKIYEYKIYYAFYKLTENIINTFKFHYTDGETINDFQQEIIFMLLGKMPLFDPKKDINKKIGNIILSESFEDEGFNGFLEFIGDKKVITQEDIIEYTESENFKLLFIDNKPSRKIINKIKEVTPPKAYSYFGTIVKRYCIVKNKKNYQKKIEKSSLEELDQDPQNASTIELVDNNKEKLSKFLDRYVVYCIENIYSIFPESEDAKIADAILDLFKRRSNLEIFNKKALYIHIRESINVKTPKITKIADKLYKIFKTSYIFYLENNQIKFKY